jgi:hypothetical protein
MCNLRKRTGSLCSFKSKLSTGERARFANSMDDVDDRLDRPTERKEFNGVPFVRKRRGLRSRLCKDVRPS